MKFLKKFLFIYCNYYIKQNIMKQVDLTKENIPLLFNTPCGTKMYLVIKNRVGSEMWIKEAVYQGFTKRYRKDSYYDYKMASPDIVKTTLYHVKFTVDGKPITIVCASPSYWKGQRGYDTNAHLECGADYITKMQVNVSGCIDVYFTTDVDAFKNYIVSDNILGIFMDNINDKIRQYQEMKHELEDSIMNILGVSRKYFL